MCFSLCLSVEGEVSQLYSRWQRVLVHSLAHMEAYIDFSEDENIEYGVWDDVMRKVCVLVLQPIACFSVRVCCLSYWSSHGYSCCLMLFQIEQLEHTITTHLSDQSACGERIRNGVHIAILGSPNVGKSRCGVVLCCVCVSNLLQQSSLWCMQSDECAAFAQCVDCDACCRHHARCD